MYSKTAIKTIFSVLLCMLFACSSVSAYAATTLDRIDITDGTALTLGNQDSTRPKISGDGRYIVFNSLSNNYVAGDDNNSQDVFLYDQDTNEFELISKNTVNDFANGNSIQPSISANGRYVTYESVATNIVASDTNGRSDIFLYDRQTGTTERISVSSDEDEGNHNSNFAIISGDGSSVVFQSHASNLVTAANHFAVSNVFVRSIADGTTELISLSLDASSYSSGNSSNPSISEDGRYVTFQSIATNLVADTVNIHYDIFLYDRQANIMTFVSRTFDDSQSSDPAYDPSISADGRYVTFSSNNDLLVAGDNNDMYDIFLYDRQEETLIRVIDSTVGETTTGSSNYPGLSSDGRYLTFSSTSDGLVAADTNDVEDVFIIDLQDNSIQRVSISSTSEQSNAISIQAAISQDASSIVFVSLGTILDTAGANLNEVKDIFIWETDGSVTTIPADNPVSGNVPLDKGATVPSSQSFTQNNRYVVFESNSANIMSGYTNPISMIYLYDSVTDTFEIISSAGADTPANSSSSQPAITPDGRYVVFQSSATNLTEDALTAENNIFRYDRQTDTMLVITTAADLDCANPSISSDGRYIVFESAATNLIPDDDNETTDIFLYDVSEDSFRLVSPGILGLGNGESTNPKISSDGQHIAFQSEADNLIVNDLNTVSDIFLFDVLSSEVQLVSQSSEGGVANGESISAVLSSDGRYVAYVSLADDIVNIDESGVYQVFLFDSLNETTVLISKVGSVIGDSDSTRPSISADGTFIVFQSTATNLVAGDENAYGDVFAYSVSSEAISKVSSDGDTAGDKNSLNGSISPDGSLIVFESLSLNWENINTSYDNNGQLYIASNDLESEVASSPTPSTTSTSSSQSYNSTSSSTHNAHTCSAIRPNSAPQLFLVNRIGTTAVLWISPTADRHTGYVVWYGEQLNMQKYADSFEVNISTGMIVRTIYGLNPKQTYSFIVQAKNDCAYSDSSNFITSNPSHFLYKDKKQPLIPTQENTQKSSLFSIPTNKNPDTFLPKVTKNSTNSVLDTNNEDSASGSPQKKFWTWLLSLFKK